MAPGGGGKGVRVWGNVKYYKLHDVQPAGKVPQPTIGKWEADLIPVLDYHTSQMNYKDFPGGLFGGLKSLHIDRDYRVYIVCLCKNDPKKTCGHVGGFPLSQHLQVTFGATPTANITVWNHLFRSTPQQVDWVTLFGLTKVDQCP